MSQCLYILFLSMSMSTIFSNLHIWSELMGKYPVMEKWAMKHQIAVHPLGCDVATSDQLKNISALYNITSYSVIYRPEYRTCTSCYLA